MAPGMQEECLGGLFLPPTPLQLPRGKPAQASGHWVLGSREGNGLDPNFRTREWVYM